MSGICFRLLAVLLMIVPLAACSGLPGTSGNTNGEDYRVKISGKSFENQELAALLYSRNGRPAGMLEFENCQFNGETNFILPKGIYQAFPATTVFRNCSFNGEVHGEKTQFLGQVNFSKCSFANNVSFQNAAFLAPVGFRECNFNLDFLFQNVLAMKEATWMGSHFYGISFFQGCRFFEKAQFQNAVFHGNSDFTLCRFAEGALFDFIRAEGKLDFMESRTEGLMTFRKAECQKTVDLSRMKSFAPIRFFETTLMDSVVTSGMTFYSERLEFKETKGKFLPAER